MDPITLSLGAAAAAGIIGTAAGVSNTRSYKIKLEQERDKTEMRRNTTTKKRNELRAAKMNDSRFDSLSKVPTHKVRSSGVFETDTERKAYKAVQEGVAKLVLPKGTKFVSPIANHKLRCEKAYVYEIQRVEEGIDDTDKFCHPSVSGYKVTDDTIEKSSSYHKGTRFTYEEGTFAKPRNPLDKNAGVSCTDGIHFFRTKNEAIRYHKSIR